MPDKEDARADLVQLAELLRSLSSSRSSRFSVPTTRLLTRSADALNRYLSGEAKSLDRAFGLTHGRGGYERPLKAEHQELVYKAFLMHVIDHKSLTEAAALAGYEGSMKEFRKLWDRYKESAAKLFYEREITPTLGR